MNRIELPETPTLSQRLRPRGGLGEGVHLLDHTSIHAINAALIGNRPSGEIVVWSVLSFVLLLAGIGALAWYYAVLKHRDYGMDRSIYVVGSEQQQHFKNLFAMLELLEFPWAGGCYHASYGMVTLPHGMGRLKSREGTKVDADDLLDTLHDLALAKIEEGGYAESTDAARETAETIGQGALKMYVLQVSPDKNIQFDPNETISFTGDTGPAVQYSHARIQGILRKGLEQGKVTADQLEGGFLGHGLVDASLLVEAEEQEVLKKLADFGTMIRTSAENLTVAPVANYLLDLTKLYARMYHEHEVLTASSPELMRARVQLALAVAQVVRNGLGILTIDAPERM